MSSKEHGQAPSDRIPRDYHEFSNAPLIDNIKVGDRVYIWHYNCLQDGYVKRLSPKGAKVLVGFKLKDGRPNESWKPKDEVRRAK